MSHGHERRMGVHRQGAVVTWPTFALLVDREHSRGTGADLAFRVDGHDAMATLASHMDMQLSRKGTGEFDCCSPRRMRCVRCISKASSSYMTAARPHVKMKMSNVHS